MKNHYKGSFHYGPAQYKSNRSFSFSSFFSIALKVEYTGRPIPTAQLAVRMTTLELSGANKSRKPTSPEMAGARRAMGRRGGGGGGGGS